MKKIKFTTIILGVFMFLFTACVKDNDFSLPDVSTKIPEFKGKTITIAEAITKSSAEVTSYKEDDAIEGYVISSDQGGNFYKNMYIQSLDGNTAFSVTINKSGLYTEFPVGSKVQVRLKDLSTRVINNRLEVGFGKSEHGVDAMPTGIYTKSVIKTKNATNIKELSSVVSSLKTLKMDEYLYRLITIKNVSFEKAAQGKTYHQKANDSRYGTNYQIQDSEGGSLTFRTGKFAKYKDKIVPSERVNITGIITKFKDNYQFLIRTIEDVEVIPGSKTTEKPFEATTVTTLNETFDNVAQYSAVTLTGWYSKNTKGSRNWQGGVYSENKYIQASNYSRKKYEAETEAWIVTPGLDVAKATNKNFSFESKVGYAKGATLEVFISTNFNHETGVEKATWKKLTATLATPKSGGYSDITKSGNIDLSAYSAKTVHIAFKYTAAGNDKSGSWQIDNVRFNYDPTTKATTPDDSKDKENDSTNTDETSGNTAEDTTPIKTTGTSLFSGSNFDDWDAFTKALKQKDNKPELKEYAKQSDRGINKSKALAIKTQTTGNDYVFTALVPDNFSTKDKTKITFYLKGTMTGNSINCNLYKEDQASYHVYKLETCEADKEINPVGRNSYAGAIDTKGKWIKITLNIKGLTDIATTKGKNLFALKIGKKATVDLLIDHITIE